MPNKRALIIGETFFPEEFIINDLVKEWREKGYDLEVLTRAPSYPFGKVYDEYQNRWYQKTYFEGITIHRIPFIPGYQKSKIYKILNYLTFMLFATFVAIKIGKRFDRVFVYQTGPLTVAFPAVLLNILYNLPFTIWTQDLWPDTVYAYGFKRNFLLDKFLNSLVSLIYNRADTIMVSCEGFKPKILPYLKKETKILWVPNWSIIDSSSERKKDLPGGFNFTFAGNIGKVQNLKNVLLGFKNIPKQNRGVWLNIIGDGSMLSELKKIC